MVIGEGDDIRPRFEVEGLYPVSLAVLEEFPSQYRAGIEGILLKEEQIMKRIGELTDEILADYVRRDVHSLVAICIMDGAEPFYDVLVKILGEKAKAQQYFLKITQGKPVASSYHGGTESVGEVTFTEFDYAIVNGQEILVVDDIVDTGETIKRILTEKILPHRPTNINTLFMLDKQDARGGLEPGQQPQIDYTSFIIPKLFVVGFGLDYADDQGTRDTKNVYVFNPSKLEASKPVPPDTHASL